MKAANRIGRRAPLSLRTTEELRDKLEQAASASGRSLTAELERRLELSFEWERAFTEPQKWLAETKAKFEKDEADTAEVTLRRSGWPKVSGTKWGTVLCRPGSVAMIDGRAYRVLKADFPNGTFNVEPAPDLMDETEEAAAPSPAIPAATAPTADLEETMYRAVLRALRDARSQDLGGETP